MMTSVLDWGADPNGVLDSTAAFANAASNDGPIHIPTGTYVISSAVAFSTPGQIVAGDGRGRSIISVPPRFSGGAVFVCNIPNQGIWLPGPQFRDFSIAFQQPNTTPIQYPPAIACPVLRARMRDLRISNAWTGISMTGGNGGGTSIIDCEISAYNIGVAIDGATDSVRIRGLHFWPFDVPSALQSYFSANANAISSARCDDLHIDDCLLLWGLGIRLYQSANGNTFGRVTGTDFDSCSGINMSAGTFSASNCFFSEDAPTRQSVLFSGGYLNVSNSIFNIPNPSTSPVVGASSGQLILANNMFILPAGQTLPQPVIFAGNGARLTATGNRANDFGNGTGNFIAVAQDDWHIITGNAFMGWGSGLPATYTEMIFANNSAV